MDNVCSVVRKMLKKTFSFPLRMLAPPSRFDPPYFGPPVRTEDYTMPTEIRLIEGDVYEETRTPPTQRTKEADAKK